MPAADISAPGDKVNCTKHLDDFTSVDRPQLFFHELDNAGTAKLVDAVRELFLRVAERVDVE